MSDDDSELDMSNTNALLKSTNEMNKNDSDVVNQFFPTRLLLRTVIGAVIGLALGVTLALTSARAKHAWLVTLIGLPGELLLRALRALVVPLVVTSIILAASSLPRNTAKRLAWRTAIYMFGTMLLAAVLGVTLVLAMQPGSVGKLLFFLYIVP